ncbi:hypothetical protein FRC09_010143 [Ceratobasidium sp. 395]|nr:hypothetical protein FRC09_010143 [Ceratobasidium sp. 395]
MPKDIISLARANKFFRALLMTKSSIHIWHGAMRNVPGIPPCPTDLSEPHYLALVYVPNCSLCGTNSSRRMDEMLRVRLCPSCRSKHLIKLATVTSEIAPLVLNSKKIVPSKRSRGCERYVLKSDVQEVQVKLAELEKTSDTKMLEEWRDTRKRELELRSSQASALITFLDGLENDRWSELQDLKKQHRVAVYDRLLESGWDKADLVFNYPRGWEWISLVEQAKILTDRTWMNLRPKLIPLLEANRVDRLEREKSVKKHARKARLEAYLKTIKEERAPIIDVTASSLVIPGSTLVATSPNVQIKHMGIFPKLGDALEWDQMKQFLEDDLSVPEMEERVNRSLPEITQRISEWTDGVEDHLVELLHKGREADNLGRDIPDAVVSLPGTSNLLENATRSQKILLRADSLFESKHGGQRPPLVYDAAILNGYSLLPSFYSFTLDDDQPLDVTKFRRHAGAQMAARKILEHIGKLDATFLEMRAAGQRYRCGRCHDRDVCTWEEIVNHFSLEQQTWERMQAESKAKGITFRNVHDPTFVTSKPMIKLMTRDELVAEAHESSNVENMSMCKLCSKAGFLPDVQAKESDILTHLADVHNISKPKSSEHYGPVICAVYDDYPVDDYEDPIFWGQNHHWPEDDDRYDGF